MKIVFLLLALVSIIALSCQEKDGWISQKMNTHDLQMLDSLEFGQTIEFTIWGTMENSCWMYSHKDSLLQGYNIFYDFYKKKSADDNLYCAQEVTDVEITGALAPPGRGLYTFHFSDGDTAYMSVTVDVR